MGANDVVEIARQRKEDLDDNRRVTCLLPLELTHIILGYSMVSLMSLVPLPMMVMLQVMEPLAGRHSLIWFSLTRIWNLETSLIFR
jgi:hypothetical protein